MPKPVYLNDVTFEAFNAFLLFELKWSDKKSTLAPRRYIFHALKSHFHGLEFNRMNFASYIAEKKKKGLKNSTLNKQISFTVALAKYLKTKGFDNMTYFPEHRLKTRDILSWEEMNRIASVDIPYHPRNTKSIDPQEINHRDYCIVRLLSEVGCRREEVINLTWDDLDGQILTFRDTKNFDSRSVVITNQLSEELRELPRISDKIFNLNSVDIINKIIRDKVMLLGITKKTPISPHLFRHSVITNLALSGAPLKVIMELVGHRRMDTTAGYINNTLGDMENMLYQYSGLWGQTMTLNIFKTKALEAVTKLLTWHTNKVKLEEDSKFLYIKVPKNVFLPAA